MLTLNIRMSIKRDLVVIVRWPGLSISETVNLLCFICPTVSRDQRSEEDSQTG